MPTEEEYVLRGRADTKRLEEALKRIQREAEEAAKANKLLGDEFQTSARNSNLLATELEGNAAAAALFGKGTQSAAKGTQDLGGKLTGLKRLSEGAGGRVGELTGRIFNVGEAAGILASPAGGMVLAGGAIAAAGAGALAAAVNLSSLVNSLEEANAAGRLTTGIAERGQEVDEALAGAATSARVLAAEIGGRVAPVVIAGADAAAGFVQGLTNIVVAADDVVTGLEQMATSGDSTGGVVDSLGESFVTARRAGIALSTFGISELIPMLQDSGEAARATQAQIDAFTASMDRIDAVGQRALDALDPEPPTRFSIAIGDVNLALQAAQNIASDTTKTLEQRAEAESRIGALSSQLVGLERARAAELEKINDAAKEKLAAEEARAAAAASRVAAAAARERERANAAVLKVHESLRNMVLSATDDQLDAEGKLERAARLKLESLDDLITAQREALAAGKISADQLAAIETDTAVARLQVEERLQRDITSLRTAAAEALRAEADAVAQSALAAAAQVDAEARRQAEDLAAIQREEVIAGILETTSAIGAQGAELQRLAAETENYNSAVAAIAEAGIQIDLVTQSFAQLDEAVEAGSDNLGDWAAAAGTVANGLLSIANAEASAREQGARAHIQRINERLREGKIDRDTARARRKAQKEIVREAFRQQKEGAIAQATIAGAVAIIQAYAQTGPIAGSIFAGVIGGLTAAQIGVISAQRPSLHIGTRPGDLAADEAVITRRETLAVVTPQARDNGGVEALARAQADLPAGGAVTRVYYDHHVRDLVAEDEVRRPGSPMGRLINEGKTPMGRSRRRRSRAK